MSCFPQTLRYDGRDRYSDNYNVRQKEMKDQIDLQTNPSPTFKKKNQTQPAIKCDLSHERLHRVRIIYARQMRRISLSGTWAR